MQSNAINTTFVNPMKLHFLKTLSEMITSQFIAVLHKTALYWKILYNRVGYAVMFILDMTVLYMTFT